MTTLYFLRHGEASGNVERFFHGAYDSDLTENGRLQAELAAKVISTCPVDAVYASDLKRAFDTAMCSAKALNLPVIKCPSLREIDGGKWENVPWDELPLKFSESYNNWCNHPHLLKMPDGETMEGFQNRICSAVEEIIKKEKEKNILIATHGTVIKVFLCKIMGYALSDLNEVPWVDNASITVVEIGDDMSYNVIKMGDNSHLGDYSTLKKQTWWKEKKYANRRKNCRNT